MLLASSILYQACEHPINAMPTRLFCLAKWLVAVALFSTISALNARAQAAAVPPRITQAITDSNLVTLRGNVHPLARPDFDRGLAPASLPMDHMMLLLKRSSQQEAALDSLLAQQQDRNSPNYHHWLTAAQFGAEFGPSSQDIQNIEAWLQSHGFSIDSVSNGRTVIEFSGSVGEVQSAFHTEIHRYVLPDGKQHWANSTNPEIPAALAPVVSGMRSLNSFYPKPLSQVISRVISKVPASRPSSQAKPQPMYTFQANGACSAPQAFDESPAGDICFMVTPADLGAIYDVSPLWSNAILGSGETIAIANDSNINLSDVSAFRSLMGLVARSPKVILADGADPGVTGDESEAVLDAEWSGATAPDATIDLVIAPSTNSSFGGDVAAEYIVDNNLAPILSYSFGACEAGTGGFYGPLWQQAAAEGITVLIATGDDGSSGCDAVPTSATTAEPATQGLQVNGLASTQYDVAVGGTDFNDFTNPCQYWSSCNPPGISQSASSASALSYIPETAWNESCTNSVFSTAPMNASFGNVSTPEQACNNVTLAEDGFVIPVGGSGGVSTVYPKPSWQSGLGPSTSGREVPDVSLFSGTGAISASFYYLCESDLSTPPQSCSLSGAIDGVGGTSVSVQVMAGIVALIDQQAGSPQGNINLALYGLAVANTCPSAANPSASCIFYDVTTGTNAMPCAFSSTVSANSLNCFASTNTDTVGILGTSATQLAYNADAGYDLATGLGSINAKNLVMANVWAGPAGTPDFSITSSNPTVTLSSSEKGTMSITITPLASFTGTLNLSCPGLPSGDTCSFSPASPVTVNGATTVTVTISGAIASVPGAMNHPTGPGGWPLRTEVVFAFACFAALLLFGIRVRRRRWNPILVLLSITLFAIAGCSGGGSSSGGNNGGSGGGGPTGSPFMTTVTATTCSLPSTPGCSTGLTHSLVFTIE